MAAILLHRAAPRRRIGEFCVLALGSNLGDRRAHILAGIQALQRSEIFAVEALSRLVESEAWGPVPQGPYLNLLASGRAEVGPEALLAEILRIEEAEGRVRELRYGPRTLDIDIVFYGDRVLETPQLTLPHPRWQERPFVRDLLSDVVSTGNDTLTSLPGVREALLLDGRLSAELSEVEPLFPGIAPIAGESA